MGDLGVETRIILKLILNWERGQDSFGLDLSPVTGCYEHGIEPSSIIKGR
jgi:hypothetical protein